MVMVGNYVVVRVVRDLVVVMSALMVVVVEG